MRLFTSLLLLAPLPAWAASYVNQDFGGGDLVLADGDTLGGSLTNIGRFVIPQGATVRAAEAPAAIRVEAETIDIAGVLDVTGQGHAGGRTLIHYGYYGEGPGGGKYGGYGCVALAQGGGGAGHAGAGGNGGDQAGAGSAYGTTEIGDFEIGSGGGGGGGSFCGTLSGGRGGAGGGAVHLMAEAFVRLTGTIRANGDPGVFSQTGGGGGGGSGGEVVLSAPSVRGAGTIEVMGGQGADGGVTEGTPGNSGGGGGSGGRVKVSARDLTAPSVTATGGAGGSGYCCSTSGAEGLTHYLDASPVGDVLLCVGGAADDALDLRRRLLDQGTYADVHLFQCDIDTPSVSELSAYDAVVVFGRHEVGFFDAALLGDNLATYADQGGGVVVAGPSLGVNVGAASLGGRFVSAGYLPFEATGGSSATNPIFRADERDHPIVAGISTVSGASLFLNTGVTLAPGAWQIGWWRGGPPAVVVHEPNSEARVVALNLYPVSTDAFADGFDPATDGARLVDQALQWTLDACPDDDLDGVTVCDATPDCDDDDASISPLVTDEAPNGLDDDCDGPADEGTVAVDDDGDGYCEGWDTAGDGVGDTCTDGAGVGDCDDGRSDVHPGAPELEDGVDNDCDGVTELDDTDGDGLTDEVEQDLGTSASLSDTDGDGLSDGDEVAAGLLPLDSDSDDDGVLDGSDNCPLVDNPDQVGDACETDDDDDDTSDGCGCNTAAPPSGPWLGLGLLGLLGLRRRR